MNKYIIKNFEVEAQQYSEGLEDGIVYVIKNRIHYREFKKKDKGYELTLKRWKKSYKEITEIEQPYIMTDQGKEPITKDDFIVIYNGKKYKYHKDIFNMKFNSLSEQN